VTSPLKRARLISTYEIFATAPPLYAHCWVAWAVVQISGKHVVKKKSAYMLSENVTTYTTFHKNKKDQLSLTSPRDACEMTARLM